MTNRDAKGRFWSHIVDTVDLPPDDWQIEGRRRLRNAKDRDGIEMQVTNEQGTFVRVKNEINEEIPIGFVFPDFDAERHAMTSKEFKAEYEIDFEVKP